MLGILDNGPGPPGMPRVIRAVGVSIPGPGVGGYWCLELTDAWDTEFYLPDNLVVLLVRWFGDGSGPLHEWIVIMHLCHLVGKDRPRLFMSIPLLRGLRNFRR